MSTFQIKIGLGADTIQILMSKANYLYALRSTSASNTDGSPTIWHVDNYFLSTTEFSWTDEYLGFNSTSQIQENEIIIPFGQTPVDPGVVVTIDENGRLIVSEDGPENEIAFVNDGIEEYTVGLSASVQGAYIVSCAFPLVGYGMTTVIEPIQKVALMFSNKRLEVGSVVEKAMADGALIDLTGATLATVSYSVDGGWVAVGDTKMTKFNASEDLQSILITPLTTTVSSTANNLEKKQS